MTRRIRIRRRPEAIDFPPEVDARINRVHIYHKTTKLTYESVHGEPLQLDWDNRPTPYRSFTDLPRVSLPTSLLDLPIGALSVLESGIDALPDSQLEPEHNLKTIATWLHMADGLTVKRQTGDHTVFLRSCPSSGALYPYEIYVLALAIDGLDRGLYHYTPRDFALTKLRDGDAALTRLKRGRPELELLKSVPAAMLVSTIYCRSSWKYRARAYRYCLLDAGHLVQNLVTAGTGLGIQTVTRLRVPDAAACEVIGVSPEADYGQLEHVQAMVMWGEPAKASLRRMPAHSQASGGAHGAAGLLSPIPRQVLAPGVTDYPAISQVHRDCVSSGVAVAEVHKPNTELDPLPPTFARVELTGEELEVGQSLRESLLGRRSIRGFGDRPIPRSGLARLTRLAFRGGSFAPIHPDGPHVGLVRPFWIINGVADMDKGAWYYHPPTDRWSCVGPGDFRADGQYVCLEQAVSGGAAAVCFMAVNLHAIMTSCGPDAYRLAHLEAGAVGQRMYLAAHALGWGCCGIGAFYDDDVRRLFTMEGSGWEVIYAVALGMPME